MTAKDGSPESEARLVHMLRHPRRRYEDENRFEMLFEYHDTFFDIILSDKPLPGFDTVDSIEQQYLTRYDDCSEWDGGFDDMPPEFEDQERKLVLELHELMIKLLQPEFLQLPPATKRDGTNPQNLQEYIDPEILNFYLATLAGEPKLVKRDKTQSPNFHPPIPDPTIISTKIPVVEAKSIQVIENLAYSWVLKVSLDGKPMVCKLTSRSGHDSLPREYTILQQILDSGAAPSIQVPSMRGVIKSQDGGIVGILLDYVKPSIPNLEAGLLTDRTIAKPTREKWALQIEEIVKQLHDIDVIWGDAKTANILVDENSDAWILDFGGGHTVGWVPEELVGTKEGDLQALKKIVEFIRS